MRDSPHANGEGCKGDGQEAVPTRGEGEATADPDNAERGGEQGQQSWGSTATGSGHEATTDPERGYSGSRRQGWQRPPEWPGPGGNSEAAPDAYGGVGHGGADEPIGEPQERKASQRHSEVDWGVYEAAVRRQERVFGRLAPRPTEVGPRGNVRLSSRFAEWMMGPPPGWITEFGFSRKDEFRLIGNGVVPRQAALALKGLMDEEDFGYSGRRSNAGHGCAAA